MTFSATVLTQIHGYVKNPPLIFTDSLGLDPEWDQQVWRAQQDLLEFVAPAIRYGIGSGDQTLFGLPKYIRQWQGIDDPTLPCYSSYQAGEWTAIPFRQRQVASVFIEEACLS